MSAPETPSSPIVIASTATSSATRGARTPTVSAAVPSTPRPRQLGRASRRTLLALAEVVVPPGPIDVSLEGVVDFIDDMVGYMPRLLRVAFPLGLWLLEHGTRLFGFSVRRFSSLTPDARARYVDRWIHAGWVMRRDLIKGVKGLALLAYYSDPRVGELLGFFPDEHVRLVSAERLRRYGSELGS